MCSEWSFEVYKVALKLQFFHSLGYITQAKTYPVLLDVSSLNPDSFWPSWFPSLLLIEKNNHYVLNICMLCYCSHGKDLRIRSNWTFTIRQLVSNFFKSESLFILRFLEVAVLNTKVNRADDCSLAIAPRVSLLISNCVIDRSFSEILKHKEC